MAQSLAERLEIARRSHFVGRVAECALLRDALAADELPFNLLHIFGPGGIGKTSLLREYARIAKEASVTATYIDARNIEPSPRFFLAAIQSALGLDGPLSPQEYLAAQTAKHLIFIDTFELLAPLDGWLRNSFLPQMPAHMLFVFAGRTSPSTEWRSDPGWQPFLRVIQLRNLSPEESREFLTIRQISTTQNDSILDFTHGHPLALSLAADLLAQQADGIFQPEEEPDMIRALVDRFVQNLPGPDYLAALEACAMIRVTSEALLAVMLESDEVGEIFTWLRTLSFIESERRGIFPHDLAREALTVDLRWRNPDRYAELHSRARQYYMQQFVQKDSQAQHDVLHEYIYLHRDNPIVRPVFEWQENGTVFADRMRHEDKETVLSMIETHEGLESAKIGVYWLENPAQTTMVYRDVSGQLQGILVQVALEKVTIEDRKRDLLLDNVLRYLDQHTPLRSGEVATFFRFWMARDSYQAVSPVQSRIFISMVQHYLATPGLAYTIVSCVDPDFWNAVFAYADLHRIRELDFLHDGRQYGLYGHDWRKVPPLTWLNLLAEREVAMGVPHTLSPISEDLIVLSEIDFADAVRDGLRHFHDASIMRNNPLLRSRIIVQQGGSSGNRSERIDLLRQLLQSAAESLRKTPRKTKFFRAIHHTYLQPAATQEKAAELLDLPFSTYRRHLRAGLASIAEDLWEQELNSLGER